MFLARTIKGTSAPAIKHPLGPGGELAVSFNDGEEDVTILINGRIGAFDGIPLETPIRMDNGEIEIHVIEHPPPELLARDDVIVTLLLGHRSWPESTGHRHAHLQVGSKITIDVANQNYFDEAELHAQRRHEMVKHVPGADIALVMETSGMNEKQARAHLRQGRATPAPLTADSLDGLIDKHLGAGGRAEAAKAQGKPTEALTVTPSRKKAKGKFQAPKKATKKSPAKRKPRGAGGKPNGPVGSKGAGVAPPKKVEKPETE